MNDLCGAHIHISGIVQGVGFRPFVHLLANRHELKGWVRNTSAGVDIEVDGSCQSLQAFSKALIEEAPPLARIDRLDIVNQTPKGYPDFKIVHSQDLEDAFLPISPDVSICTDCLRELFDPGDRRFLYPFINCTNCGPRFTIIQDIPYDRPKTTMSEFKMCLDCEAEYHNPLDRRFHAQPIACPKCGPHAWLESKSHVLCESTVALTKAQRLLKSGKIVAIKGLGGFHLACDAENKEAVSELRRRKLRVDKPFALMMPDMATVDEHCFVNELERDLLLSRQRPIVILRRRPESPISVDIAPGQDTIGVMLPYTPLHYLLFSFLPGFNLEKHIAKTLVMTSGNISEEPIATDNSEARQRLSNLADAFLMHNRPIHVRCDDSVTRVFSRPITNNKFDNKTVKELSSLMPIRRARGYAPFPVFLPWQVPPMIAAGAELKNTFCLTRDQYAFMSHHIGDMENYETLKSFTEGVEHFTHLFRIKPRAIAHDLHPNYLATRFALDYAKRENVPAIGVQHHYAHIAACMAENGLTGEEPVIGIAFDGTGFGEDGAIWGGEFLIADYLSYKRPIHLAYVPLPGGDAAIREPWRMALAWLDHAGVEWNDELPPIHFLRTHSEKADLQINVLRQQLALGFNAPPTSSLGRLFDAISAIIGVREVVNYEAQAAIELEAIVDNSETGIYPFNLPASFPSLNNSEISQEGIDPSPIIQAVVSDVLKKTPVPIISARFHNSLADLVFRVCLRLREETNISTVALSGGVWQNMVFLKKTILLLSNGDFKVLIHREVPTNDGGLALGQAVIAAKRLSI